MTDQDSPQNSDENSKPRSLVEWSKTPEFREGWMAILAKNEAKPSIYSPGYEAPGSESRESK